MKYFRLLVVCAAILLPVTSFAQQGPEDEEKKLYEMIQTEVSKLEETLELESWQVFYVDSILKHNFPAMREEFEQLSKQKVSNSSLYMSVQDKWLEKTDSAYMKIFTKEQWAAYLKSGAGKQQKARAKRRGEK